MFSKALLYSAILLVLAKLVFRLKFRELGQRLDRAVTVILVLIVITYGAHVGYWMFGGK